MNLVSLIGRVVKEVEVQQLQPSGKSVFNNTIAVQNVYRNNDDSYHSHFIQVVAWGKIAERIGKFVKKGDRIGVEGRLNTRRYTNKNHQEVYVTEVVTSRYFISALSFSISFITDASLFIAFSNFLAYFPISSFFSVAFITFTSIIFNFFIF